jgi:LPS-assembly protein
MKMDNLKLRQFKIHNLAFAIGIASTLFVEQVVYADSTVADNTSDTTRERSQNPLDAPLAFGFYDRSQLAQLPVEQRIHVPAACRGVWITPISPTAKTSNLSIDQTSTTARSDHAYYDPEVGSVLEGNVRISQPAHLLTADKATLNLDKTIVNATGNVKIASPGLVSYGGTGIYHLDTKTGSVKDSKYIVQERQAHGTAGEIVRESEDITRILDSVYSTCEPDAVGWKLKSSQLVLNQETGRGVARDAALYIGSVPIFYSPYFNFPIDSRRASGVLIPSFRYSSKNGLDVAVPYYLNLAPNYDATITPREVTKRRPMIDGEFRFLTPYLGQGIIDGSFMPNDPNYNNQNRKELSFLHTMTFDKNWSSRINLNYVSDKDFFSDIGKTFGPINTLIQERSATVNYNKSEWGLDGSLQAINYQELDNTVADINRPYGRVQMKLNYDQGSLNGWERFADNDTGYFQRDITDGSGIQINGIRQYNTLGVKYNFRDTAGYLIPTVSIRSLIYKDETNNKERTPSVVVPQFTLDSGLTFERDAGSWLQTLEPRFFYAYSPYVNQSTLPVFDSTYASYSYSQLFNPSRFLGNDRLDDNNFATLGITNRYYDENGLERLRIGVADRLYLSDRKTRLAASDAIGKSRSSGVGLDIGATWNKHLSYDGSTLFLPSGQLAVNSSSIHYTTDTGRAVSFGYIFRKTVTEDNQIGSREATASFVQPVYNNFRIVGSVQYDYKNDVTRDALVGVDYDSCCWSVALYGRSFYNNFDVISTTKPHTGVMLQITFKGLTGNSDSSLSSLLKQKIYGFTQVDSSWQNR